MCPLYTHVAFVHFRHQLAWVHCAGVCVNVRRAQMLCLNAATLVIVVIITLLVTLHWRAWFIRCVSVVDRGVFLDWRPA